jgi:DNA polymerase III delta subunit
VPKKDFSEEAIPSFDAAPSVVAITGDVAFFVEEAAARARERLASDDAEVLRFPEDSPPGAAAEALLNRSLFSARRLVEIDISRLLGADSPGELALAAFEAWARSSPAGKREAFRRMRRLLVALDLPAGGDPGETAEAIARKVRRKDLAEPLAELLRELPEEKGAGGATLVSTLRLLLERENDGLVALLTAASPPKGAELLAEVGRKGLLLDVRIGEKREEVDAALGRLALARAKQHDVRIDPEAIARLRARTDSQPALFASELDKLLDWAGEGGQIRAADVGEQVVDESSEDVFGFFEALGRRDAGEALARLERLFSGREIRAGQRSFDSEEDRWPQIFLGMLTDEIRRMLLVRSRLAEAGAPPFEPQMSFDRYKDRVAPYLDEPLPPFGKSPFGGRANGYPFFKAASRAARFTDPELARALARAADVDVKLKSSAPVLETLTAYVGGVIAGA